MINPGLLENLRCPDTRQKLVPADDSLVASLNESIEKGELSNRGGKKKIKKIPQELVCDTLLNQNIFTGVGNIIKNEVLFSIHLHPETKMEAIPARKLAELIKEARNYSFDFLKWKKDFVLRKNWLAHTKKICPRDHVAFIKKYCGKTKRRTFYCEICQVLYEK